MGQKSSCSHISRGKNHSITNQLHNVNRLTCARPWSSSNQMWSGYWNQKQNQMGFYQWNKLIPANNCITYKTAHITTRPWHIFIKGPILLAGSKLYSPEFNFYKYSKFVKVWLVLIWKGKSIESEEDLVNKPRVYEEIKKYIYIYIPNETSPATAISWKLRLKVSFIWATRFLNVGSHFSCTLKRKSKSRHVSTTKEPHWCNLVNKDTQRDLFNN